MEDENEKAEASKETEESRETEENGKGSSDKGDERVTDAETAFEEYAGDNECPECGEPVIEIRANCPNCGYEYKDEDYSDKEAGSEFVSGTAVDDEGNEIPDDESGGGGEEDDSEGDGGSNDKEDSGDDDGSESK
jgi:rubredoxin